MFFAIGKNEKKVFDKRENAGPLEKIYEARIGKENVMIKGNTGWLQKRGEGHDMKCLF